MLPIHVVVPVKQDSCISQKETLKEKNSDIKKDWWYIYAFRRKRQKYYHINLFPFTCTFTSVLTIKQRLSAEVELISYITDIEIYI